MNAPMDLLDMFPVRKTKKQKEAFRQAVQSYAQSLGYNAAVEKGSLGARNLVIGDPEKASCLVTAHYDTCARMLIPNLITPCCFWGFVGYQLLVTALILVPALLAGVAAGLIFGSGGVAGSVCYLCVWFLLILMLVGPANRSNVNDNTSGVITVLEIARVLPENQRSKVCFVLFDLEEMGLLGSAAYRKAHKAATDHQLVFNLDCVGDGDHIRFFPTKKLKKDRRRLTSLYRICGYFGKKDILVQEKGFCVYPSDQGNFPYGLGICALHRAKSGILYLGRIHTPRDTVLEQTNVNLLRAAISSYISGDG